MVAQVTCRWSSRRHRANGCSARRVFANRDHVEARTAPRLAILQEGLVPIFRTGQGPSDEGRGGHDWTCRDALHARALCEERHQRAGHVEIVHVERDDIYGWALTSRRGGRRFLFRDKPDGGVVAGQTVGRAWFAQSMARDSCRCQFQMALLTDASQLRPRRVEQGGNGMSGCRQAR